MLIRFAVWLAMIIGLAMLFHPKGVLAADVSADVMVINFQNGDWVRLYDASEVAVLPVRAFRKDIGA